jgi:hypothetical protein
MGMADDEHDPSTGRDRPQDPLVARLRPDPSQPPQAVLTLAGLLGDSDRPGFRRLYFTRDLDYYAEFQTQDIVDTASIPPSEPPFLGDEATRVTLKRDAVVAYTRVRSPRPIDEFDLDVRLGRAPGPWTAAPADVTEGPTACGCPGPTKFTCLGKCVPDTSHTWCGLAGSTCVEVCRPTEYFCRTHDRATCGTCGQATCATCQATSCQTCHTCPATCLTCQATCHTCETCGPKICP